MFSPGDPRGCSESSLRCRKRPETPRPVKSGRCQGAWEAGGPPPLGAGRAVLASSWGRAADSVTSVPGSGGVIAELGASLPCSADGWQCDGEGRRPAGSGRGTERQEGMGGRGLPSVCSGLGVPFSPAGCQARCLAHPVLPFFWGGFCLEAVRIPAGTGVCRPLSDPLVSSPQEDPAARPESEGLLQGARAAVSVDRHRPALHR